MRIDVVTQATKEFMIKEIVEAVMSPTLSELFRDYVPKFINKQLVWFKKPNAK